MEAINASIGFDRKLYAQDISGSVAHSEMLAAQKASFPRRIRAKIAEGLNGDPGKEIETGQFDLLDPAGRHPHEC
jgi:argininosuccinate lyase